MQEEERERWEFLPPPDMKAFERPVSRSATPTAVLTANLPAIFAVSSRWDAPLAIGEGSRSGRMELFRVSGPIPPVFEGP